MARKTALALTAQHGAQEPSQNNKLIRQILLNAYM